MQQSQENQQYQKLRKSQEQEEENAHGYIVHVLRQNSYQKTQDCYINTVDKTTSLVVAFSFQHMNNFCSMPHKLQGNATTQQGNFLSRQPLFQHSQIHLLTLMTQNSFSQIRVIK
ncbi:hypothetical protein HELRODRAFT_158959 [Helobdella robusta]|uniref:Uncharacterized protein n=1 Tax=Helobdella robusta TaxID=6412 RepID=T1ENF6_HELRO|nr:hypothetical protein HELRODRAFT_158959 [Helobdella robusta]ESO12427.1 hypothetical protein HELRODRAFT_158959 [Helobdella robusta]